jgi:hypothetical protein
MEQRVAMSRRARTFALMGIAAVFLVVTLPVALRLGFNAEETVGLLRRAPERLYPGGTSPVDGEQRARSGMRTSARLPVWGYRFADGSYLPVMIDGHVSALSFYPSRALTRIGPTAARVLSVALGLLGLLLIYHFGRRIGGEQVGLIAALLAATSSQYVFVYSWVRPDEQLDSLAHLGAVLCMIRFVEVERRRWFLLGCFLLGLGVACKNTALWSLFGIVGATLLFRLVPRARPLEWAAGAGLFLLPLLPQIAYLVLADSGGAMSGRLSMISAPWEGLAPDRLGYSVRHFAESVGHGGSLMGGFVAGEPGRAVWLPGVGYGLFAAVLLCVGAAFSRASTVGVRAFAAGLGLVLLQYFTFYYRGHSYYLLLAPWIPIAVAVAGVGLYNSARDLAGVGRIVAKGALVLAALVIAANALLEVSRYRQAAAAPGAGMFDGEAQERVARDLVARGIERPIVTTYGGLGVYELLSGDRLRPRYAFPYFHAVSGGDRADFRRAWTSLLERLGPGRHVFVLAPNPSPVDTSPLERGGLIAEELRPAAVAMGARVQTLERHSRRGRPVLSVVEVSR